jgi:ubiquinone/menaquinone biosynthesis C-methylase UbiE
MTPPFAGDKVEEQRILQAYQRREAAGVDSRYSCFEFGSLSSLQQLERCLLSKLHTLGYAPLEGKRILEVGCGTGSWLQRFIMWQARPEDLFGVDLQESRIIKGRNNLPSSVTLKIGNASNLEFADESFDLVCQFTLFSSVLSVEMKRQIAREMTRVLKRDRHIVWYDFFMNNPFNPDVSGVGKREVKQLFAGCRPTFQRLTLAPPLSRRLGRISPLLCDLALRSHGLSTHYLAFLHKP